MSDYRPRRLKTRFPVTLIDDDGSLDVVMRDISVDGACIEVEATTPILAGSAMSLQIGPARLPALVQWSRKGSIGLRFMERPDPQLINLIPADE